MKESINHSQRFTADTVRKFRKLPDQLFNLSNFYFQVIVMRFPKVFNDQFQGKALLVFPGEIVFIVIGINDLEEKVNIDIVFPANLLNGSITKSQLNSESGDDLQQLVIQMNYLCHFHIGCYLHD